MTAEHDKAVTGDVEAIHRLRVATRRLRASLRMLREVAPSDQVESVADELGWLCGAIGAVRDLDVLAQLLEERATRLEADFIRALEPLSATIRRQRATEQERLVAALDSERYRGLVLHLAAIAPEPAADSVALGAVAARLVRAQFLALREKEFVEAARALGASTFRVVVRHILPNALGPVIVAGTIDVAAAIIAESTLSFLGLGFPADIPTWGRILYDAKDNLDIAPHWALFAGGAIFLAVLVINFIGDGLRDALDPRRIF